MNQPVLSRIFCTSVLARAVVCLTTIACCATAMAQQLIDLPPRSVAPAANELLEGQAHESVVAPSESGFWFLNTRHSPQSFDHNCPRFCPDMMRFEHCQGFRRSSFQELCAALEPGVPVCIMVHGSFVDTPSFCRESQYTWRWLRGAAMGQPMQMIYFHWPSYRALTPLVAFDVNQLGRRGARNGYYLAELVHHLPPECPVCLIGHSHGARVISAGLHLLAGGAVQGIRHPCARANGRQIRTVLTGAAIDHDWFNPGQRYDRALCSTECLLNMTNRCDPALRIYPLRLPLLVSRPLGLIGLTRVDRRRLGVRGEKVLDYDVSAAIGVSHLWPHYFRNPRLAMLIRNYVYFPDQIPAMAAASESGETVVR